MNITQFLNEEYSDSALYMNYRSLPSYIDGLKNSGRKIVYTIKKRNIKSRLKVSALGSAVVDASGYLHGDSSIQGAIVTRAQSFCGANNTPILKGEGSFGTRFTPESAAPRYIFARPADYFDEIFVKADDKNLVQQEFEGDEIEPVYYAPTIPLLLVNGAEGIGVGFAGLVLARSTENIVKALSLKLDGKKVKKELFIPSWHGFKGTVKEVEPNKWEVKGLATFNGKKVLIEEVPISFSLFKYINKLKELKEIGIIDKYVDYSEDDNFKFEVTLSAEELKKPQSLIFEDLCLVDFITENLTCVDENNAIKEFSSISDIFDSYYDVKIECFKKRISSELKRLEEERVLLSETVKFIKEVIKGSIDMKAKKSVVEADMKKKKYVNIERLISMPLYSITEDKAKEIMKKYDEKVSEIESFKNETPITLWKKDLDAFEKAFKKVGNL